MQWTGPEGTEATPHVRQMQYTCCKLTPDRAADQPGFQTWLGSRLLPYLTQLQAATNGYAQTMGRLNERSYRAGEPGMQRSVTRGISSVWGPASAVTDKQR